MEMVDVVSSLSRAHVAQLPHSIIFKGAYYPSLFFSLFFSKITKETISLQHVDMSNGDPAELKNLFATTFLGNKIAYWLGDISALDQKQIRVWGPFLSSYAGPHTLMYFAPQDLVTTHEQSMHIISVPEYVDAEAYQQFFSLLYPVHSAKANPALIKKIFQPYTKLSWDHACILMQYHIVVGRNVDEFYLQWADKLITVHDSLFTLATHFFAQNEQEFFAVWRTIAHQYSLPFWTVFWSEQLMRAYGFITYKKAKQVAEAKKIAFRLPFNFVQKEWTGYSLDELQHAHDYLYTIDFNLKNGGSEQAFELFYFKFFLHHFKSGV